jgi:hypothetical protein
MILVGMPVFFQKFYSTYAVARGLERARFSDFLPNHVFGVFVAMRSDQDFISRQGFNADRDIYFDPIGYLANRVGDGELVAIANQTNALHIYRISEIQKKTSI